MKKLTKQQRAALHRLETEGFVEHATRFGRSQINRVYWNPVDRGLAVFDFGPRGSSMRTQGFMLPAKEEPFDERLLRLADDGCPHA